jgi:hypothetical protein
MAAIDLFTEFTATLAEQDRSTLATLISVKHADLLAARSEEARLRIVQELIEEVREASKKRVKSAR